MEIGNPSHVMMLYGPHARYVNDFATRFTEYLLQQNIFIFILKQMK